MLNLQSSIVAIFFLIPALASAANLFVTPSGAGSANGSNWSNALSSSFTPARGNVYYLADGSYGAKNLTTAASGTTLIEIRKCTTTDGVSSAATGYVSTLCDGQATFGDILFDSDYWTIDGVFRNETCTTTESCGWSDQTSYGFFVTGAIHTFMDATIRCGDNITIRYTAVNANGGADAIKASCFTGSSTTNFTAYRNLFYNANGGFAAAHMTVVDGCLFEENFFRNNDAKETIRGQSTFKNCVIRRNIMKQACLAHPTEGGCTCHIAIWDGGSGAFDNVHIYGNIIDDRGNSGSDGPSSSCSILLGGNGTSWVGSPANNALVFNNTIVGVVNTTPNILVNGGTGNICRNNLFYNNVGTPSTTCNTTSNNGEEGTDPFVSSGTGNFRLDSALAGSSTSSPAGNATDIDGVTRGADGTFDRGAFEFNAGGTPPTITTTSLPDGTVGVAYNQTLAATGDATITWDVSAGTICSGLTLESDGDITGTPTTAQTCNFTARATNSSGNDTQALSITVAAATPSSRVSGGVQFSGGATVR